PILQRDPAVRAPAVRDPPCNFAENRAGCQPCALAGQETGPPPRPRLYSSAAAAPPAVAFPKRTTVVSRRMIVRLVHLMHPYRTIVWHAGSRCAIGALYRPQPHEKHPFTGGCAVGCSGRRIRPPQRSGSPPGRAGRPYSKPWRRSADRHDRPRHDAAAARRLHAALDTRRTPPHLRIVRITPFTPPTAYRRQTGCSCVGAAHDLLNRASPGRRRHLAGLSASPGSIVGVT